MMVDEGKNNRKRKKWTNKQLEHTNKQKQKQNKTKWLLSSIAILLFIGKLVIT